MTLTLQSGDAILLAAAAFCCYFLLKPIVNYFLDPLDLRKYPAPSFVAATTPFWLMKETWMQRRSRSVHNEFKKHGDVLRVGPNHIIFNIPQAVTDIYGHLAARKLVKDVFYDKVAGDCHDIVNTREHEDHANRRRYLSNSLALKTVVDMEPIIRENFGRLLGKIDEHVAKTKEQIGTKTPFNVRQWLNYFTLDVIGDMAFGLPMGFVENGGDRKQAQTQEGHFYEVPATIDALHQGVRYAVTIAQAVSIETVHRLQAAATCFPWMKKFSKAKYAEDWENICINQLRRRMDNGVTNRPQGDFIHKMLADRNGASRELPFRQLVAESLVFMNAGSDTTAAALTNTLYYLMSNPECITKLRAEVETRISPSDPEDIVPYELVRDLPYLRACIDESLRLRPPIAYPLQRLVASPEGAMIAGHHVKQGTVVAVAPYSIHRVEPMFPNADAYNPDRWLDESDPEQLQNLKAHNIVFSQGPRQCLGRHIAIVELQILISSLTRRYDLELMHKGQELLIFDRFNANPGPLPIQIRRRNLEVAAA